MRFISSGFLNKLFKVLLVTSLVLGLAIAALVWWIVIRPMPQTSGTARVPGLRAEVVVRRDQLGVPHVRAQSLEDLYFAQGWVTAQDRLWQMDVLRRMGGGTLAEVAGESAYRSDANARIQGMRRIAEAAARSLPADQRRFLDAYAAGVNAFLAANRSRLPMEFRLMRYQPRPWTADDSMLVGLHLFRVLTTSWRDEFLKLLLISKVGAGRAADLLVTRTGRDHPPAQELSAESPRQEAPPRGRAREREAPPGPRPAFSLVLQAALFASPPSSSSYANGRDLAEEGGALPGSNNWVVSGRHTASGHAMLANDPHLNYSVPGIWYSVHLEAPGMNVAGVSLPGMPAVIIGHSDRMAWGATNLGADVQDIYQETFDEKRPDYLVDGAWKRAETRKERIAIRGREPAEITFTVTRHGPLVLKQGKDHYALRWVAADGAWSSLPFFRLNAARNWSEFTAALADYPGPAQNFVYADADGNIGYQAAGKIPIRPRGDGSVPLRGDDSANDWTGYIPFDQLPRVYNPPSGMIATANGRVVPDGYPYPVATKWEAPDRTERIYELLNLDPQRRFRPEDFTKIQTDVRARHYKFLADAFATALERRRAEKPGARRLAEQLRAWNAEVWDDSSEASLVHFARHQLLKELLEGPIGPVYLWYRWRMSTVFLENALAERPARWLPAGLPDFDEALARSVERAAQVLGEQFQTPDSHRWPWGRLMQATFAHPISERLPGFLRSPFVAGPFRQAGNSYTVKQTTPLLGASMRMVVDFGNLDETLLTLTMGESGHVFSRNYRDQFESWRKGEGLKNPFSKRAVERATQSTLRLLP